MEAQGEAQVKKLKVSHQRSHMLISGGPLHITCLPPRIRHSAAGSGSSPLKFDLCRLPHDLVGAPSRSQSWVPSDPDLVSHRIVKTADGSLPLPEESPQDFRMLPEYLFENVADYIEFLSR